MKILPLYRQRPAGPTPSTPRFNVMALTLIILSIACPTLKSADNETFADLALNVQVTPWPAPEITSSELTVTKDNVSVDETLRAIQTLRAGRSHESVPSLLKIAERNTDERVARAVWNALGDIAQPDDIKLMLPFLDGPLNVSTERSQTLDALQKAIKLAARKPEGAKVLQTLLASQRFTASSNALLLQFELLDVLDKTEAHAQLLRLVSHYDLAVYRAAVDSLEFTSDSQARTRLAELLNSSNEKFQQSGALAAGRWRDLEQLPHLIALLDGPKAGVKGSAQWALQRISGRLFANAAEAREWQKAQLDNADSRIAQFAEALHTVASKQLPVVIEELSKIVLLPKKTDALLLPLLQHREARVRAAACDALASRAPGERCANALIAALKDSSNMVATSALRALKNMTRENLSKDPEAWTNWLKSNN